MAKKKEETTEEAFEDELEEDGVKGEYPEGENPEEEIEEVVEENFLAGAGNDEPPKPKISPEEAQIQANMAWERELRRYIKRDGGLRKNLPKKAADRVRVLMKKLKRTGKPKWNQDIVIPGYDNPTVSGITYSDTR